METVTQSQIDFLSVLHEERGLDFDPELYASVSKQDASADIDTLMRDVGTDEPPTEEQIAEIHRIREFLGPRDEDTMPTDRLGAARLLRGLGKAEWARRRELSRQRFASAGAILVERDNGSVEQELPQVEVSDDDIPF